MQFPFGMTRKLLDAVDRGDEPAVETLLAQGANPNARANDVSALYRAVQERHATIARLLVENGAETEARNGPLRETALGKAAERGDEGLVHLLLDSGARIDGRDRSGNTPLMVAAGAKRLPVVRLLLESGADVNANASEHGWLTPLMSAVRGGDVGIARALVERGADVNGQLKTDRAGSTSDGETALMKATFVGHTEMVSMLLEKGADPTRVGAGGRTALSLAEGRGHHDTIGVLVGARAEAHARARPRRPSSDVDRRLAALASLDHDTRVVATRTLATTATSSEVDAEDRGRVVARLVTYLGDPSVYVASAAGCALGKIIQADVLPTDERDALVGPLAGALGLMTADEFLVAVMALVHCAGPELPSAVAAEIARALLDSLSEVRHEAGRDAIVGALRRIAPRGLPPKLVHRISEALMESDASGPSRNGTASTPPIAPGTSRVSEAETPNGHASELPTAFQTGRAASQGHINRRIRVFVSSTFRDMDEERDGLMTHAWPRLRQLCQERHVELVEVDLRWGITESQCTRGETLKTCLDEIDACRPFFIGLLGERYGWTPQDDAFSADLQEEQPWIATSRGKSVTELEILHGVLNNPDAARGAFFYFRDPAYARRRGPDFLSETAADEGALLALKAQIRSACDAKQIPLREGYPTPRLLAAMIVDDLSQAIDARFPEEDLPDWLTREARENEAFAEIRRRTYIERSNTFAALDRHVAGEKGPLVVLGGSGMGKSALLANWVERWRKDHPEDFIVQHYIGGTRDSTDHLRLMTRMMAEIKRWSGDSEAVPTQRQEILRDFPDWLARARAWAAHEGVRSILAIDALDRLDDPDHTQLLGWLPERAFTGPLRLVVSMTPDIGGAGDPPEVIRRRGWQQLHVGPLTPEERRRMIVDYLGRFGKKLDEHRLVRLVSAKPAANPLYLTSLLDDLRVTGTHDRLDQRLTEYLAAPDVPALLQHVLARYQRDYEHEREGLVAETLGLICEARRGLSESELLQLLRPAGRAQLPYAYWAPLRAALGDSLVDRGGILDFANDTFRAAVVSTFASTSRRRSVLRRKLVDYFEAQPITARTCDELPWLLGKTDSHDRLRACLLNIDRFMSIFERDVQELRRYWVEQLREQQTMGRAYLDSFERWSRDSGRLERDIVRAARQLGSFLHDAALYPEAELLMRRALTIDERSFGQDSPGVVADLANLAQLLRRTNRLADAEPLMRHALAIIEHHSGKHLPIFGTLSRHLASLLRANHRLAEAETLLRRALDTLEKAYGSDHPETASTLNELAQLLSEADQPDEAEALYRRALASVERSQGSHHPGVAAMVGNLAEVLRSRGRFQEAEPLYRRALKIDEHNYGHSHPSVARDVNNLALSLVGAGRPAEAEPLIRRSLAIDEEILGADHPEVAVHLINLAGVLQATNRLTEVEHLLRRALRIDELGLPRNHPHIATSAHHLADFLHATHRFDEAESLYRRALAIRDETFGRDHPRTAQTLNNLAQLLHTTGRLSEAEPLMRRVVEIFATSDRPAAQPHPRLLSAVENYACLLQTMGRDDEEIGHRLERLHPDALRVWDRNPTLG